MDAGTLWADRYRVGRRLGSGAMATVWEAEDERLGRTVAIKRLHLPRGMHAQRLQREARIGAALRHPGLLTVFDVITDDDALLLIMEHVDGGSLADRLGRGPLPAAEVVPVLRDVASALDHAHANGVVHRDVKPANILVGRDGRARLGDLGIATGLEATRLTADGDLLGTPAYLAPEQVEGRPATAASDVYALAAVAFEALAGRRAHPGRNALEVMHHVRREPAPDLREAWPDAPAAAARVLAAAMAADPGARPPTATRLVEDLATALEPAPATAPLRPAVAPGPPPPRAEGPRRRIAGLLAAGALVAVLAAVVLVVVGGQDRDPAGDAGRAAATAAAEEPPPDEAATPEPAAEGPAEPADRRPGRSPAAAVRGFYELAAAGDFASAWALAGDGMRAAFGSFEAFERDLGSLESIEFTELEVRDRSGGTATVDVRTVARHTDRTDRCAGPLRTVRGSDGSWRVEPAGISCEAERAQP